MGGSHVIYLTLCCIIDSPLITDVKFILLLLYNTLFLLTFLTTILLYVIIVVRIIQSERSMRSKIQLNNELTREILICHGVYVSD